MAYTPYTPLYQPYTYQPIQPIQNQQQNMIWVRNAQEAAMYPVAPNNAVCLWDSGASTIYLKQADASGRPSMKTYDLVERIEQPVETKIEKMDKSIDYATKSELTALAGVVKDINKVVEEVRKEITELKENEDG